MLNLVTNLNVIHYSRAAALEAHESAFSLPVMATQKILAAATTTILG
jgi:hypothetical protein